MKPVIAVDVDDVLYPTAQHLADVVGGRFGLKLDAYSSAARRLRDEVAARTGMSPDEAAALARDAFIHESFIEMAPFPAAVTAVERLTEHYQIMAITARSNESHELTRQALRRDFGSLIGEVFFPNTMKWVEPFAEVDKMPHLREVGATWLIDDKPQHLLPLVGTGIRGGLFGDYPWNQVDALPDGVVRLSNWDAVLDHLLT